MSGGGGGDDESQVSEVRLPDWLKEESDDIVDQARRIAARPYQSYQGQTVAPLNADTLRAYEQLRAMPGARGQMQAAADKVANLPATAQGYLDPYLAQVEQAAVGNVQRQGQLALNNLRGQARNVGAFGGSRQAVAEGVTQAETARQAGELSNQIRSQGWNTALAQALQGATSEAQLAQAAQQAGITQAGALERAGAAQQAQQQAELGDLYRRWLEERNYPLQQLQTRLAGVSGVPYGTSQYTGLPGAGGPTAAGVLGGAAGGAMTGAAIGSYWPGYGTAIGAVAGGLLGAGSAYYG
jgi:hypothetical protein